jgi:CRISPR system Cascade subunit CasA
MFSFNLIDDKWIPCIMPDGRQEEKNLKEVLSQAGEIKEIFDSSPLVTTALHRLLLAVLHRNFGPGTEGEWQIMWHEGKGEWQRGKLSDYLTEWRHRFDLFSEKHPFYQCASLPFSVADSKGKLKSYEKPIANLIHELSSGDNATLFDHTTESEPKAVSAAEAARLLVAFQSFAVGGLITRLEGEGPSANNAPLVKGAVVLAKGKNLFQTLMLNLHRYNRDDEEPFYLERDDAPVWERDEETNAQDRPPKGYLDLLTWQSRRVKLHPEQDESGQAIVRWVVIMKGNQFPDNFSLHQKEPMLAFRKVRKPGKGQDPWPPVAFEEDRALWRDSLALFHSIEDERARPKIMSWLHDLSVNGVIPLSTTYDLSIMGLVTSKAKISLWRHERLPLPLVYLEDEKLIAKLKEALDMSEYGGRLLGPGFVEVAIKGNNVRLPSPMRVLAQELLPQDQKGLVDPNAVKSFIDSLSPARPYWARLGMSFNRLVGELAKDKSAEGEYGATVLPWWAGEVRLAARQAFEEATNSFDRSGRLIKAVTKARDEFDRRLNTILKPYKENERKGGEEA